MTVTGIIVGHPMGHYIGEGEPQRFGGYEVCPTCGAMMSPHAQTCVQCYGKATAQRQTERAGLDKSKMDNHHRFSAALEAGWDFHVLLIARPFIPTWDEICARCPEAVIKWRPEIVIERWFNGS